VAKQFLTPITLANLETNPVSAEPGAMYFNSLEKTIKAYDGFKWYDVAGPKEILDHQHGDYTPVTYVQYDGYVAENLIAQEGGSSSPGTTFTMTIDGGDSSGN
jgi:hypothetical protein